MKAAIAFSPFWLLLGINSLLAQEPPSYARHVRPFLAKYCVECHNPKALKAGLDLATYKSMLEGSDRGAVLVPGKPAESKLLAVLDDKAKPVMPPKSAKYRPSKNEIGLLHAWVAAGARDDSSLVKTIIPDIKPKEFFPAPIGSLASQPRGGLLTAGGYRAVTLFDPVKGDTLGKLTGFAGAVTGQAFNASGTLLAIAAGKPGTPANLILQPVPKPGELFPKPREIAAAHDDTILDVAFSPDGKMLATCGYDTRIKLWDVAGGKEIVTLKEHSDSVYAVAFSPDGKLLASCAADRAVKVWEVPSGKLLYTLSEATDWLCTLAFSPVGNRLATGGVDKSIRVYEIAPEGGKLLRSVFAHEGPVQKLLYSSDGHSLYSVGQDRVVKAWDAGRMEEKKVFERQPDIVLSLALVGNGKHLALGRHDGVVAILDLSTGKVVHQLTATAKESAQSVPVVGGTLVSLQKDEGTKPLYDFPQIKEQGPNNSPGQGQKISLPSTVAGSLDRAGEMDFYRFEAGAGYQLGVHLVATSKTKDAKAPKLEPVLLLLDAGGRVLAESGEGFLGHTFADKGVYALGVRDRDLRGAPSMPYQLHLGNIPVVTSVFPMGLQRGTEAEIRVEGVNLGAADIVVRASRLHRIRIKAAADATLGSKIGLGLKTPRGVPLGNQTVVVGEFAEVTKPTEPIVVPGTANGRLPGEGTSDTWSFAAKKGQRLIIEVEARRLGSPLDSVIDIVDVQNKPVERAVLRCQAKTFVTFRDHDSATAGIRIDAWGELAVNDYVLVGSELMRIKNLPTHPDADCNFFTEGSQRLSYLDTTPTHHANGSPMYKVSQHPPGTTFPPNGFPVFSLTYRNDDGGPGYGRDSRLFFDPPADGVYRVRIQDARGQGGANFTYRLTVRPPRPSYGVRFSPTAPVISRGSALPLTINADRIDGYQGPIHIQFTNVPPGFHVPATTILPEENSTAVALFADAGAKEPDNKLPLTVQAHALIVGQKIVKEATGDAPKLTDPGDILAFTDEEEIALKPGGQTKLTMRIERKNGFLGRVPLEVRGLPHGVRVLDIGLNGILITERETRRTMVLYAEPWVTPLNHPIVVLAKREGKNSEHAAKSVTLKVGP